MLNAVVPGLDIKLRGRAMCLAHLGREWDYNVTSLSAGRGSGKGYVIHEDPIEDRL